MTKIDKNKLLAYLERQCEKATDAKVESHYFKIYAVVKSGRFDIRGGE
jgi:hypothetical protein